MAAIFFHRSQTKQEEDPSGPKSAITARTSDKQDRLNLDTLRVPDAGKFDTEFSVPKRQTLETERYPTERSLNKAIETERKKQRVAQKVEERLKYLLFDYPYPKEARGARSQVSSLSAKQAGEFIREKVYPRDILKSFVPAAAGIGAVFGGLIWGVSAIMPNLAHSALHDGAVTGIVSGGIVLGVVIICTARAGISNLFHRFAKDEEHRFDEIRGELRQARLSPPRAVEALLLYKDKARAEQDAAKRSLHDLERLRDRTYGEAIRAREKAQTELKARQAAEDNAKEQERLEALRAKINGGL